MLVAAKCAKVQNLKKIIERLPITSGGLLVVHIKDGKVVRVLYERSSLEVKDAVVSEMAYAEKENTELALLISTSTILFRPTVDSVLYAGTFGELSLEGVYTYLSERGWVPSETKLDLMVLDTITLLYENESSYSALKAIEMFSDIILKRDLTPTSICVGLAQLRECCINMYVALVCKRELVRLYRAHSDKETIILAIPAELTTYSTICNLLSGYKEVSTKSQNYVIIGVNTSSKTFLIS